ncbi:hypothetical protein AB0J83_28935 [Actinoplanes sp. NPDC049596]|uniref:hypothetical protein n=1 Tax=unclassified Actinoplanes TaxID=2626549 RepID=UPI003435C305
MNDVGAWLRGVLGRRLDGVVEARHWFRGRRDEDAASLIHAWLYFEGAGPVLLHGCGEQLEVADGEPYAPYDMQEAGETRVGPAQPPDLLAGFVGAMLVDGSVIIGYDGVCGGLRLRFDRGDLVLGSLGDDWYLSEGEMPAGWRTA